MTVSSLAATALEHAACRSSAEGDRRRTRTLHAPRGADGLSRGPRGMVSLGTGPQRPLGVRPW